ncbi:hypothetical protein ASG35_23855 [Burkholderia sp. Leaf177]|nr:hypothetical protein ASG35_23855 [Burkholderia sp. Leaf177]
MTCFKVTPVRKLNWRVPDGFFRISALHYGKKPYKCRTVSYQYRMKSHARAWPMRRLIHVAVRTPSRL